MTGSSKMTVQKLCKEVNILKDALKEMETLKQRVVVLEDRNQYLEAGSKNRNLEDIIKCKKCGKSPEIAEDLKNHHESVHGGKKTKCKSCSKTFARNCELEVHLRLEHKEMEMFKCEHCDKTFVLKWRLEKHMQIHKENGASIRFCHYYNNDKVCPFADIGCMFKHENSELCRYQAKCSKKPLSI